MERKAGVGHDRVKGNERIDPSLIASTHRVRGNLKGRRLLQLRLAMTSLSLVG